MIWYIYSASDSTWYTPRALSTFILCTCFVLCLYLNFPCLHTHSTHVQTYSWINAWLRLDLEDKREAAKTGRFVFVLQEPLSTSFPLFCLLWAPGGWLLPVTQRTPMPSGFQADLPKGSHTLETGKTKGNDVRVFSPLLPPCGNIAGWVGSSAKGAVTTVMVHDALIHLFRSRRWQRLVLLALGCFIISHGACSPLSITFLDQPVDYTLSFLPESWLIYTLI